MSPVVRTDLLDSMGLVGRGLGILQQTALKAGRGQEMATLEMRLAMLRARLQAGSAARSSSPACASSSRISRNS